MQFSEVLGQQEVKQHLVDMVSQNRVSHALLFLGKEGTGTLPLTISFAQYLVCEKVNPTPAIEPASVDLFASPSPADEEKKESILTDACGECPSCRKAAAFIHPDIHFSFPVITKKPGTPPISDDYIAEWREFISQYPYGNSYDWLQFVGAENKQGNITARECNEINHKLSLKAFESKVKILIMWMPEMLGTSGNKLLKLIEEPPPDTVFLFAAEEEQFILPTILSRTQLIRVPPLSASNIQAGLIARANVSADLAGQLAAVSEGNYHEALQSLQLAEEDWQGLLRDWLNTIFKNALPQQAKWIDEISRLGREKQKQFLKYFIHLLQQALKLRFTDDDAPLQTAENETDFAKRLNNVCNADAMEAIVNELDKASFYVERNANPKMLFHALSIRLKYIFKDNSLILIK